MHRSKQNRFLTMACNKPVKHSLADSPIVVEQVCNVLCTCFKRMSTGQSAVKLMQNCNSSVVSLALHFGCLQDGSKRGTFAAELCMFKAA